MKEEALKLADKRDTIFTINDAERWMYKSQTMIRRLVEELDKQGEPFGYLCDWGNDSYGLTRQTFYYGERGSPTLDDWNEYPKVHHNLPLYTTPQTKPLSDEEIEEVIRKHWNREYGNRNMLTLCKAVLDEADK